MSAAILRADARSLPLPDATVDLLLCSPPYFSLRSYTDNGEHYEGQIGSEATPREWLAAMLECTAEWARVLKPSGSIFVNLGDKYSQRVAARPSSHQDGLFPGRPELAKDWKRDRAAGLARMPYENVIDEHGGFVPEKSLMGLPWRYALACMDDLGLILRAEIVWAKPNSLPESVQDRVRRCHEQLFHFTLSPRYYAAVDEIREPYADAGYARNGHHQKTHAHSAIRSSTNYDMTEGMQPNPLGKLPGSVWEIPSQPLIIPDRISHARCCGRRKREGCTDGLDHFAAFPFELPRRIILGWSPPGICTACGEGRRPVGISARTIDGVPVEGLGHWKRGRGETAGIGNYRFGTDRHITGYACSCTPYTDHPASERASNRRDRAPEGSRPHGDYARKQAGPWREYHLDRWDAPPARPALVVDPFGGTGTTALMADVLGRDGISFDRSGDYCRLAQWRTSDPGERAKAMQVPRPAVVPDDQEALFGLGEVS